MFYTWIVLRVQVPVQKENPNIQYQYSSVFQAMQSAKRTFSGTEILEYSQYASRSSLARSTGPKTDDYYLDRKLRTLKFDGV